MNYNYDLMKSISIKFHKWMLENDTQDNADKWCNYSDGDMFNYFIENVL